MTRQADEKRTTDETSVAVTVVIDGTGKHEIDTGVGFFDHMLAQLSRHSLIDMTIRGRGDTEIDDHHLVEDVGITLGKALRGAIGEARGIRRYGSSLLPMDEALARVAVDVSARPVLVWRASFPVARVGGFDTELAREFFQALAVHAGLTLHVESLYGTNAHHMIECCFKAAGRALREALAPDPRDPERIPSTKGTLSEAE